MKTNKKEQGTVTSTIDNLPKELRDRIVNLRYVDTLNGFTPNGTTTVSTTTQASEPLKEERTFNGAKISINYGTDGSSIKKQLKEQGFSFDKELIKGCEDIRIDILTLMDVKILTSKQGIKAFKKLNLMISHNVVEHTFGDVNYKFEKVIVNNK